jgi:exonuclease VII small subunit
MKRLEEALASLDAAVDMLEDTAASHLATPATKKRAAQKPMSGDDMGSLFSSEHLSNVKQRLDDAIERLENALEVADGTH